MSYWLNARKRRIETVIEPEADKETQSPLQRDAYMDVGSRAMQEQLPRGLGDDCRDAGGRATQGAVAEGI